MSQPQPQPLSLDRRTLYRFKFDKLLGRGGTGTVYRGIDTNSGGVVAVKLFHANFFRNPLHMRDLAKSAKKFKKLDHSNVVKIYEFISGKEGECLVLEYVDGPDLKWYIANRPWNLQERLVIVAQICNGLQYLHDQKLMHHDFKPANVLFTRRGLAKICDFSLCGSSALLSMLDPGHDQVTPMFVAPEMIRKEKVTHQSDIYSLGVTMYVMFAGRVPFEVDALPKLYQCHLKHMPDHPTIVNPRCPRDLGDIIMRALAKKPEDRFSDCDELRIILSDIGQSRI